MSWLEKLLPPQIQRSDSASRKSIPEGLWVKCPSCEAVLYRTAEGVDRQGFLADFITTTFVEQGIQPRTCANTHVNLRA